ncbi:MAG TPA: hypothetical protein VI457_09235 [Methylococcaceae bacterium]|nr:hypothetical protein [Methylococcaceae bacterium]
MKEEEIESRRRFLLQLLAGGAFFLGGSSRVRADVFGRTPGPLPSGRSIYRLSGKAMVNGKEADEATVIRAGDTVETGSDGEAIFAVGPDAFLVRANSRVTLEGHDEFLVVSMRVLTGAILSVFGRREHRIETANALVGIRGTGVYVEAEEKMSYVCTCYGETLLSVQGAPERSEAIRSRHHDAPRYIYGGSNGGIEPAPFKNHTDAELSIIEALVGRTPPFSFLTPGRSGDGRY